MKCAHCSEEITLTPPASERAKKYGGKPSDYTRLFTTHAQCAVDARNAGTSALLKRLQNKEQEQ